MRGRRAPFFGALALAAACVRTEPVRANGAIARGAPYEATLRPGRAAMPSVPNVPVVTHRGETARFYDDLVRGRLVVVSFTYTRCDGSCPRTSANLVRVQRLLGDRVGKDVSMISVTLDPEHDTPEALARYASALGAGPGWAFVTGTKPDLERLRRALGFTDPDPEVDAVRREHAILVKLGDDRSGRWSAVPGLIAPEQIVDALHRTAREPHAAYGRAASR
jgi:protein SCO1/2